MELMKNNAARTILNLLTIKSIKTGFGHDLAGLQGKVWADGKLLVTYDDDGWGGEAQIHESFKGAEAKLVKILKDAGMVPLLVDNLNESSAKWLDADTDTDEETRERMTYTAEKLSVHDLLVFTIEEAINMEMVKRDYKRWSKKAVIFGKPFTQGVGVRQFVYKAPLTDVAKNPKGAENLVDTINRAIKELGEGEMILNPNLLNLGLELTADMKSKIVA
jgi:hypothetical protein